MSDHPRSKRARASGSRAAANKSSLCTEAQTSCPTKYDSRMIEYVARKIDNNGRADKAMYVK